MPTKGNQFKSNTLRDDNKPDRSTSKGEKERPAKQKQEKQTPALNLMAVGFPVILICGLLVLVVTVPQLLSAFERLLTQDFPLLQSLSGARS